MAALQRISGLLNYPSAAFKLATCASKRTCSARSCLYVSGKHGTHLAPTVIPDLNIEKDLESCDFTENLSARKRSSTTINLKALAVSAQYLAWLDAEDVRLETRRKEIAAQIAALSEDSAERAELVTESRKMKQALKIVTRDRWDLDSSSVLTYLHLPNQLSKETSRDEDKEVLTFPGARESFCGGSHVDLALESKELEICPYSSNAYYLFGRLAQLELDLCQKAQHFLLDAGLDMMACPDFARSVVMEGCEPSAFEHPEKFLSLSATSDLGNIRSGHGVQLTGGASLYPFVAYFMKHVIINPEVLPLSYFSVGRQYVTAEPVNDVITNAGDDVTTKTVNPFSLFSVQQSQAVQCFSVASSLDSMWDQQVNLTQLMEIFYNELGLRYRIVSKKASSLDSAQSFKTSFEMFAPSLNDFVEVGNIATYDDYLSKRLILKSDDGEKMRNLFVVSGTFINVTKVIACIVEQTNGKLLK